jgi:choline kinase
MKAIILAAGAGKRIRSITDDPKCLLKINNETLIDRQIRLLSKNSCNPTIVVGYKHRAIIKHVGYKDFVFNPVWEQSNTLISLLFALSTSYTDFLVINGDTVFREDLLQKMLAADYSACAVQPVDPTEEEVKVACDPYKKVTTIGKHLVNAPLEAVGVYLFRKPLIMAIKESVRLFCEPWKLYYEDVLNECLADHPMQAIDTSDAVEIDTPEDYERAKKVYA